MGLENTLAFLENDIFIRTDLGLEEVANVSNSVLPREARTLLILIDGRKTYAQVTRLLENRKMFKEAGGLRHYLQMLIDLDYIDSKFPSLGASNDQLLVKTAKPREITLFTKSSELEKAAKQKPGKSLDEHKQSVEQLRSIVAQLINKYAESNERAKHLELLEDCKSSRCVVLLVNELQTSSTGDFETALNMTVRAFKKAKIS